MHRVFGPYAERGGASYRVIVQRGRGRNAEKISHSFATALEAQTAADKWRETVGQTTVLQLIEMFLEHLGEQGTKQSTIATHRFRLLGFFDQVLNLPAREIGSARAETLYRMYTQGRAPDTHHGALSLARSMFRWAVVKKKLFKGNPFADVDSVGRKNRGKPQLNEDGTAKLYRWLCAHAMEDDRALGALMALTLGMRAHEVVGRRPEHLDAGGTKLRITESKTLAGIRPVKLSKLLQAAIAKRVALRAGRILPYKAPWVRSATHWCCAQAKVTKVCAQALRGMYASALLDDGIDPELVARSIGHSKRQGAALVKTAYAAGDASRSAEADRVLQAFERPANPNPNPLVN